MSAYPSEHSTCLGDLILSYWAGSKLRLVWRWPLVCTGENPAPTPRGVSTGWGLGWRDQLNTSWKFKHAGSAAANTSWKRSAWNHGSWEQLVRCNDRRITLQGRKKRDKTYFGKRKGASLSGSITAKGQKRQIYTSCFKKGVIYPDPKFVCREAGSCLYAETSALTQMTFWNVAPFSLPLHRW